jgi:hypothetical protein
MLKYYYVLAGLFLLSLPAAAKSNIQPNWAVVAALSPGTRVEIHQRSGPTANGTVASVTDSVLVLDNSNRPPVTIQRKNITSVYLVGKREAARDAAVGGAIGVGIGVGLGVGICGPNQYCTRGAGAASGAIVFGGIGAVIGVVIGLHHNHDQIYRAP